MHRKVRDDNVKLHTIKLGSKDVEGGMRRSMVSMYKAKSKDGGSQDQIQYNIEEFLDQHSLPDPMTGSPRMDIDLQRRIL